MYWLNYIGKAAKVSGIACLLSMLTGTGANAIPLNRIRCGTETTVEPACGSKIVVKVTALNAAKKFQVQIWSLPNSFTIDDGNNSNDSKKIHFSFLRTITTMDGAYMHSTINKEPKHIYAWFLFRPNVSYTKYTKELQLDFKVIAKNKTLQYYQCIINGVALGKEYSADSIPCNAI